MKPHKENLSNTINIKNFNSLEKLHQNHKYSSRIICKIKFQDLPQELPVSIDTVRHLCKIVICSKNSWRLNTINVTGSNNRFNRA